MHCQPTSHRFFRLREQYRRSLKDDNVAVSLPRDRSGRVTQPQKLRRLHIPDPNQLSPQGLHHRCVSIMAAHSSPQASNLKRGHYQSYARRVNGHQMASARFQHSHC